MENEIVALKCPNCGSNDVVAESETAAVCRRCGGRFVMQKQQGPVYVKNEIFMGGGSGYTKKNMTFPVVNDAVSFKRAAIVNLMKDERTPVDLLDAEFAPVRTDVNQFLAVEADVDTTYSAMGRDGPFRKQDTIFEKHDGRNGSETSYRYCNRLAAFQRNEKVFRNGGNRAQNEGRRR